MKRGLLAGMTLLWALSAVAVVDTWDFSSDDLRTRYLEFTQILRCPKCQNQNLADSNAPIAEDLRKELYRLLEEGKTDADIIEFMVARYGDYVLYDPPLEKRTWVLWLTPAALLLVGLAVLVILVRTRASDASPADRGSNALSTTERQRLDALLNTDNTQE